MYGDTTTIRALADSILVRAEDLRHEADRLLALTDRVDWSGRTAEAARSSARDQAGRLRRTAVLHEDAAAALRHHADEVDRVRDLIAAVEARVHDLVEAARSRIVAAAHAAEHLAGGLVADLVHGIGGSARGAVSGADHLLDRFEPPPSGSVAWLHLDLPGLGDLLEGARPLDTRRP